MSVRVTVHEIGPSPDGIANPLADLESVRKTANEKLRIRRLVQVRQQSKALAAKVRQNYQQAKVKELAKIEQTKREELKAWKRKHIRQLQDEYARCISEVGEAHKAAEAAEECTVWFEEKRAAQQAVALQRGRKAVEAVARARERKESLREAKARKKPYVPSRSIAIQATVPEPKVVEPVPAPIAMVPDESSSTEPTISPYEQFRNRRKSAGQMVHPAVHEVELSESDDEIICKGIGNKENIPTPGQDYSATAFTSPSDLPRPVEQPERQRLQPFTQITELIQQRRQQQQQHIRPDETFMEQQQRAPPKHSAAGLYGGSYGAQKAVQFDDASENTLSFPTSSVLTRDDQRAPLAVADGSPRKVRPRKLVDQPKVSPVQQTFGGAPSVSVAKRGQAVLPSGVVPDSSAASTSYGASTKVQYYDYNTRYTKEYDQPVAFVQREDHRPNEPTAMEEANRYEKLQQELAAARSKSHVDRTKPALEKQQTRKDYEKLSKELDNLTRSENKLKSLAVPLKTIPTEAAIKQRAEARQRKAHEAVENLLQQQHQQQQQRALVTCPIVRPEASSDHRKVRSREAPMKVNVAEIRSNACAPPSGNNMSSDSCASIVLVGTSERQGIPLPTGAGNDGGGDKIDRMKQLLEQINEQRQLLTEELSKQEEHRAAVPKVTCDVEELCAAMQKDSSLDKLERLKRRQEELLKQQSLLQKREREVEELERQLREKMDLLQKKNKPPVGSTGGVCSASGKRHKRTTVHVEARHPNDAVELEVDQASLSTAASVSSERGDKGERDSSEGGGNVPVKIIITMNDKSTTPSKMKKRQKKLASRKKLPEAAVPSEPVAMPAVAPRDENIVEPEKGPPVRKADVVRSKKDPVGRVAEMDFSPASTSTTSTVYRELPAKIGRLKINQVLSVPPPPASTQAANAKKQPGPSAPKYQLQREAISKNARGKPSQPTPTGREANLNPQLVSYIVRLLGMSRQSIDQLGVSSTTVSTPNASIVNVSSNVSRPSVDTAIEETDRMNRLRKFIDENYNFLQEIDETLKRSDQSTLDSSADNRGMSGAAVDESNDVSRVEDVWMRTLRKREKVMRKKQTETRAAPPSVRGREVQNNPNVEITKSNKRNEMPPPQQIVAVAAPPSDPVVIEGRPSEDAAPSCSTGSQQRFATKEASLKSILKSPKRDASPKVAKIITPQGHVELINLSDREEQEILDRYSQLTERCSQRISELSQMIAQVREEKRRLIEDSLSSLDQQESTKYMDLPATIQAGTVRSHQAQPPVEVNERPEGAPEAAATPSPGLAVAGVPPSALDDPVSEEIDNIFSSKQIGLSKDSGIAMSRPLTASDIRESPSEDCSQSKEPLPFEPFLKDIHKPIASVGARTSLPAVVPSSVPAAAGVHHHHQAGGGGGSRKPPPVAITRYSPQLDEIPVHELSTILEVETPAGVVAASSSKVYDVSSLSAAGERSDAAKEMLLIETRNRLILEVPSSPNDVPVYDRFPDYDEYVRPAEGSTTDSTGRRVDLENTNGTAVPAYDSSGVVRLNLTEEREPDQLRYRSFPGQAPSFDITEDEQQQQQQVDGGSKEKGESSQSNFSDSSLPDVVAELRKINIFLKPLDHSIDNSNRSTPLSRREEEPVAGSSKHTIHRPMGEKPVAQQQQRKPSTSSAAADLELIDLLDRDLLQVSGLGWASAMLKKNLENKRQPALAQNSSSSSPSLHEASSDRRNNHDGGTPLPDERDDGGSGRPANLAMFLDRELMVRTQAGQQSITSSSELSSSPGAHSALLRSLLSISNLDHTTSQDDGASPGGGGGAGGSRFLTSSMNNVQRTSTPVASKSTTASSPRIVGTETAPEGAGQSLSGGGGGGRGHNRTLFSGESHISSVHCSSSSSGSAERYSDGLSAPSVRLERRQSGAQRDQP